MLELKFRELVLTMVANEKNHCVADYFRSLMLDAPAEKMQRIMLENFRYNLSLEDFARLCGKSLSAFKRDFQAHFRSTPGKWLLEKRLEHARKLILTSDTYVSEVAYESGFESPAHFSKAFRQAFGSPPADYRRLAEKL